MADYDSDSSGGHNDIETNVLLGYASKEPTGDEFSQLGGLPVWLDNTTAPSGDLGICKVCNGVLSLLLQLNGDLPESFPGHERRLYVLGCRRKACRRKDGSVRALRGVRVNKFEGRPPAATKKPSATVPEPSTTDLGTALFGATPSTTAQANPFSSPVTSSSTVNPFASKQPAKEQSSMSTSSSDLETLPQSFADKARISSPADQARSNTSAPPSEPWPIDPSPYPSYYLDADKEYLEPNFEPTNVPSRARLDAEDGSSGTADDNALFESAMDKTFQRFADRLSQNPEQVLRYEFAGHPLLYSKNDAVGKLVSPASEARVQISTSQNGATTSRIPRCTSCGATRVFEFQLTPHVISELEAEEEGLDGMDWGTIIVGVCSEDCQPKGKGEGEVGYVEEWVGVQWEEVVKGKKMGG